MSDGTERALPNYDHTSGTGPTLVFLHYWGGSARTWDAVAGHLDGRDTLAIDFRGWGGSRVLPGPYTLRQFASDTLAVLAAAEVTEYILVGHSMGGKVAQIIAATHPRGLRGLVLVGSAPARPATEITAEYQAELARAYETDASIADARDNILTATELPERLKAQVAADSRSGAEAARTEWPLRGIAEDITAATRAITVPALIVAGEHDRVEPVDVLRQNLLPYLADARLEVIPHSGHLIPLEAPAVLAQAIAAFARTVCTA